MTRLICKDQCKFVDGNIVYEGEIVAMPTVPYLLMHRLERMVQQHIYLKKQTPYSPGPSLKGFEYKSALKPDMSDYYEEADTPEFDKQAKRAMEIMAELDNKHEIDTLNFMIDEFADLISFCEKSSFIEGPGIHTVDCLHLGNPLELKPETVKDYLKIIACDPIMMGEVCDAVDPSLLNG